MSSKNEPTTPWGAFIMFWLLLATFFCSSVPMMVGVAVTALIPWLGELKDFNPWHILHFLWMYTILWCMGFITEPLFKYLFPTGSSRQLGKFLDNTLGLLVLALMYTIFFHNPLGAIVAAAISAILMKLFLTWLERRSSPDESESDEPETTETGDS